MNNNIYILHKEDRDNFIEEFNSFLDEHSEGFLLVLSTEDECSDEEGLAMFLAERLGECPDAVLATPKKLFQIPDRITGVMLNLNKISDVESNAGISGDTAVSGKGGRRFRLNKYLKYNYEADFLLSLMKAYPFLIQQSTEHIYYRQGEPGDGNYKQFHGIYDKSWYLDNIEHFLLPMLQREKPSFLVSCYTMYNLACRLDANQNNNNRHVLSDDETDHFMELIHEVLQYIDDDVIMNANRFPVYKRDYQFCRMLLRIKYNKTPEERPDSDFIRLSGELSDKQFGLSSEAADIALTPYHHTQGYGTDRLYILSNDVPVYSSYSLRCNIQLMDVTRCLSPCHMVTGGQAPCHIEIDGSFPDIYDMNKVEYYFTYNGKRYKPVFCERYSLTKYFGRSAYKRYPFHVSIPLEDVLPEKKDGTDSGISGNGADQEGALSIYGTIRCYMEYEGKAYNIAFDFKSHTSRLAAFPHNTYWHAGKWLLTPEHDTHISSYRDVETEVVTGICVEKYNWFRMAGHELGIGWELLTAPKLRMHHLRFLILRMAWVLTTPFFKRHRVWLFFDKIYKAGDSAEYMYKYATKIKKSKQLPLNLQNYRAILEKKVMPDRLYYLVDKDCPDYHRLRSEGYRVLRRGSFLHRLVFLNADVVLVTNSTVFAFNDYYLENSRYIRGIPDFDVVCLQHGLSVQKIALAQQRLRDNTKLYFLASKYELENLSHPVYDYVNYEALRLTGEIRHDALRITGIPRYDGLIDGDQKQIMISPTWRMQSASFVTKNEGVERDYNPEFKSTPYYKVYNGLINDSRLIAAAEEHGYRIKYVLHPIVSPQAEDFDKNPYVDIIPSTGDMSYEKMFCESSLMITDYSGIQFDFAYMRKPIIYYHPVELEAHYEEGSYHYDTMAFGEIVRKREELVNLIISYMEEGCHMKELYRMRADDFFEYDDRENCRRVYEDIIQYELEKKS